MLSDFLSAVNLAVDIVIVFMLMKNFDNLNK